jgi:hypothetical protein
MGSAKGALLGRISPGPRKGRRGDKPPPHNRRRGACAAALEHPIKVLPHKAAARQDIDCQSDDAHFWRSMNPCCSASDSQAVRCVAHLSVKRTRGVVIQAASSRSRVSSSRAESTTETRRDRRRSCLRCTRQGRNASVVMPRIPPPTPLARGQASPTWGRRSHSATRRVDVDDASLR